MIRFFVCLLQLTNLFRNKILKLKHECIKRDLDPFASLLICDTNHAHDYCPELGMIYGEIHNPNYYEYISNLIVNVSDVYGIS